ncbi:hypothetical protein LJC22_03450 [Desulfosarcina sp. OttesenSCG-928-G10]|nr:hypothetical protein [Desulfosarcina sp. OttesenSCG-928-G10]MDL2321624.1 hypothetical protein [Desulfosarcina sp. OttesenSCG-928-B08]
MSRCLLGGCAHHGRWAKSGHVSWKSLILCGGDFVNLADDCQDADCILKPIKKNEGRTAKKTGASEKYPFGCIFEFGNKI